MAELSADTKCSEITAGKVSQQNMVIKINNKRKQMQKFKAYIYVISRKETTSSTNFRS